MARWRLLNPHYLNIIDPDTGASTEWMYAETDRTTGKARRKIYHVPQLLDPKDPTLWNFGDDIVVCQEGKGQPKDIIFFGPPTPDMEPMDEEAEEISNSLKSKWTHPIETLPVNGGMNEKETAFMEQMMKAFAGAAGAQPNTSVTQAQYDELKREMEALKAAMAGNTLASPLPTSERRA